MLIADLIELFESLPGSLRGKFFQVSLAELALLLRVGVKPLAQFVRRRQLLKPGIKCSCLFRQTAGPQAIDQHTRTVVLEKASGKRV